MLFINYFKIQDTWFCFQNGLVCRCPPCTRCCWCIIRPRFKTFRKAQPTLARAGRGLGLGHCLWQGLGSLTDRDSCPGPKCICLKSWKMYLSQYRNIFVSHCQVTACGKGLGHSQLTAWLRAGPSGIPGLDWNPDSRIFENLIPGLFTIW